MKYFIVTEKEVGVKRDRAPCEHLISKDGEKYWILTSTNLSQPGWRGPFLIIDDRDWFKVGDHSVIDCITKGRIETTTIHGGKKIASMAREITEGEAAMILFGVRSYWE